jgi:PAS domain S-box-containing protein
MKQIKNSLKLFIDFFEHSSMAMFIINSDGLIEYFNPSFSSMTGQKIKKEKKIYFSEIIFPKDRSKFIKAFNGLLSGKKNTFIIELRYIGKNNVIKWWNLKVTCTIEDNDECIIFGIMDDITSTKIETDKLKLQKKYAQKVTKMKSDFLANMSHEIRTPIHTIIGMNELLLDTAMDEEQKEYAEQIKFSAEVLLSLINDILDFSKIEAGRLRLEYIGFELDKLVEEAVNLAVLEAHKKDLEVCIFISRIFFIMP